MRTKKDINFLCENSITKLSRALELIDVLGDIIDGERKASAVLSYIKENVKSALIDIEEHKNFIFDKD